MATAKFSRELMMDVLDGEGLISDEIKGHSRWSVQHEIIFQYDGRYFRASYSAGATEYQDESPWEYEKEVSAVEVKPIEVKVTQYVEL